jgi:hypothetical protein
MMRDELTFGLAAASPAAGVGVEEVEGDAEAGTPSASSRSLLRRGSMASGSSRMPAAISVLSKS